ncbi:hypothetical protein [Saccharopolyspora phatthalungensis]|uniref:DeoR/GlpR family transcriptional regulator of sugar metabolism n=1 Tax=Saccharopolyspora phatthalungensis TaxID=664693 RepID=A0A840QIM9_9PSEU|nr:hypothetical protein [Saccharopolyspora phatthalungensis]MBB5160010.1 DeoR/GlpR family transcriptional regulator of sugar metabolism [Saccharopolyspora phatthalungensis]
MNHTKFGRTASYAYGDLSGYGLLVTDAAAPEDELQTARDLGVEVRAVDIQA